MKPTIEQVRARIHWLDNCGGERSVQFMIAALSALTNVREYQVGVVEELMERLESGSKELGRMELREYPLMSEYFTMASPWHGQPLPDNVDRDAEGKPISVHLMFRRTDGKAIMAPLGESQ